MAGSKKWFVYVTDDGDSFGIELDESNGEAVNGTDSDMTTSNAVNYAVPRNLKPREATYQSADGLRTLRTAVCKVAEYTAIGAGDTIAGSGGESDTLTFVRKRPERIRYPRPIDSGQQDGDTT